jgi:hypothetical protein
MAFCGGCAQRLGVVLRFIQWPSAGPRQGRTWRQSQRNMTDLRRQELIRNSELKLRTKFPRNSFVTTLPRESSSRYSARLTTTIPAGGDCSGMIEGLSLQGGLGPRDRINKLKRCIMSFLARRGAEETIERLCAHPVMVSRWLAQRCSPSRTASVIFDRL